MKIVRLLLLVLLAPVYVVLALLFLPVLLLVRLTELLMNLTEGGRRTFFPKETYPWTDDLESSWKIIRAELDGVLGDLDDVPAYQDVAPDQRVLSQDDKWKSMIFLVFGRRVERNCSRCPETVRLLERIPGLTYAMFSILKPNKHIPGHHGYYGGVLNCHLALKVPHEPEQARIRVGDDTASWREGEMLLFNDRHRHEAWNDSDTVRAVLLMYVVRPLPYPLSALNAFLLALASRTPRMRELVRKAEEDPTGAALA